MSSLFITGNGFDIAHGIPTTYADFRNYVIDQYPEALANQCIIGQAQLHTTAVHIVFTSYQFDHSQPSFCSAYSLYRMVSAVAMMCSASFTNPPASDFSEIAVECCAWHPALSGRLLRLKHPHPLQALYRSWNSNSASEAVWLV